MPTYPGLYKAKAVKLSSTEVTALIPQVFGDTSVTINEFLGTPSIGMGWVFFQSGDGDHPVWCSGLGVATNGSSTGGGGGAGVNDGDMGDIIVSGKGTSWLFDPTVVTPAAKTLLDDGSTAAMKTTLGLGSVDNTADANKPVSSPQQTALNAKADKATTISVTGPLTGGGDLSANRSIGVSTFGTAQAGVVPPSGGGSVNYLRADGTWALPPGAGGGISGITVKEGGVSLGTAFTSLLFTASGFDVTSAGAEASVALDLTEYTGGALPVTGGGTGATTAAAGLAALGGASTSALAAHEADTTSIHGIADTSALETTTGSAAKVAAHVSTATGAHSATAIAYAGSTNLSAINVEAALDELDAEKQPLDADLTSLAAVATFGLYTHTSAGAVTTRTLAGTLNRITITNADGVAGNPTLDIGADVATLAGVQVLSNKTIALGANTVTGTTAQFNTSLTDNDFATLAGTEALTGKTINLTGNTLLGTTAQFNIAITDADFYTTGGTDVSVADGGTGRSSSITANGVIAAGTTVTGAFQTILPGNIGQFLRSAGPSSPGVFSNVTTSDVTNLDTQLLALSTGKADKTITISTTAPLAGGGDLSANRSLTVAAATTSVVGVTRLSTLTEATDGLLATIAVTPVALATGYLKLAGGTITPGSLNITGTGAQLTFGSRLGQHLMLASSTHGFGIQGVGGAGLDTLYARATTAFYWYQSGAHSDTSGDAGGGTPLMSLTATDLRYKTSKVWHQGNQGHTVDSSGINADMLDTRHASFFANREEMEALLGDLLYVGTYDAEDYIPPVVPGTPDAPSDATKPHPAWELGPNVYRHGMYWVCSSSALLDFIDADASGRYDVENEDQVEVANGDWIIAMDPDFSPTDPAHDAGTDLTLADMIFQFIPFSAENYVKNVMLDHLGTPDPHPQYFLEEYDANGDVMKYAPLVHNHPAEIRQQVINHQIQDPWVVYGWSWASTGVVTLTVDPKHSILPGSYINLTNTDPALNKKWKVLDTEAAPNLITFEYGTVAPPGYTVPVTIPDPGGQVYNDPHSQYLDAAEASALYLTEERADTLYADIVHDHDTKYEKLGAIDLHVAQADPHPLYLTQTEAAGIFSLDGHTHPEVVELHPTDGANSADIWIGDKQPTYAGGLAVGDLWIETAPLGLQAPTVKALTVSNGTTTSTVVLSWQQWAGSESVSSISLERSNDGTTWPPTSPGAVLTTDKALITYTDTGRTANTIYYYRIKAINSAGHGVYSPTVSIVTKPADVTGVNATSSGPTNSAVSWTAPAGGTYTYEVYVNSVLATTQSGLSYTASGITENETTTFGIRSKGSTGLFGTTVNDSITSGNAAPANTGTPTVSSIDHDSAIIAWTASASADRKHYEVFLGGVSKGTTTALTYTFTGLAASTSYVFGVRTVDTGNLTSSTLTVTRSTAAPPDTTPPTAPTIDSFKPESTYGRMVIRATLNTGTTQYRVDSSTNNSTWTTELGWTAHAAGTMPGLAIGNYVAGNTVYCRVYAADAAGNSTYTNATAYTLIASPSYITASDTDHYRANGTWNAMGTSRPVMGYYNNTALNATGLWFYNNKPTTTLYYGGRRTILSGKIWLKRMDGGSFSPIDVTLHKHQLLTAPTSGAPSLFVGTDIDANVPHPNSGGAVSVTLPADWANQIVAGTTYKGFAIYKPTSDNGASYTIYANLTDDPNTGRLEIAHLG